MESQPQNPEFRIIPETFHPCITSISQKQIEKQYDKIVNKRLNGFYRRYEGLSALASSPENDCF